MKRAALPISAALLAVAVTASMVPVPAQDATDAKSDDRPTVMLAGVSVAKPRPNDKFNRSMAFGLQTGTAVHFAIDGGERYFIEMDKDNSRLAAFKDDKGKVLAKPSKASAFGNDWMPFSPNISDDGNQMFFSVRSKKLPASGAKSITVKGTFTLLSGKDEKTAKSTFTLRKGEKLKLGTIPVTIDKAEKTSFGRSKATLTFKSATSFASIRSITFVDADGNEIKHQKMGRFSTGIGGKHTYGMSFGLQKDVLNKEIAVKATYFNKVDEVIVEIDQTVTLGL